MSTDERKSRFSGSFQPVGLIVSAWFVIKLLAWLHLSLMGRVGEGRTGLLPPGQFQEAGDKVIYFYPFPPNAEIPLNGWRRGIDYGGQKLTVVYSPIINSFHATSLRADFSNSMQLWGESTYVIHLVLNLLGVAGGLFIFVLPKIWPKGGLGPSLMPGLTRDDPMDPR